MVRILTALLLLLVTGCAAEKTVLADLPPPLLVKPATMTVTVPGVVITPKGDDPAWRLEHRKNVRDLPVGEQIPLMERPSKPPDGPEVVATWSKEHPPKTGSLTRWPSAKEALRATKHSDFTRIFFEYQPTAPGETTTLEELAGAHDAWAKRGAIHVWVQTPWFKRPLHGLLLLCKALSTAADREVRRTWEITITQEEAVAAAKGTVTLCTKTYDGIVKVKGVRYIRSGPAKATIDEEQFYKRIRIDGVTWALWLSNKSFPGAPVPKKKKKEKPKDITTSDR